MELLFRGLDGIARIDWSKYALLRDNVQHYLEGGSPTEHFAALHAIERAVDDGSEQVDAARLRTELLTACLALHWLCLDASAVSIRTRAIMTGCTERPGIRGTVLSTRAGWPPAVTGRARARMVHVLRHFIRELLMVTATSADGDHVLVEVGDSDRSFT